jgi:hypothetical protein
MLYTFEMTLPQSWLCLGYGGAELAGHFKPTVAFDASLI